ncbi:MAG: 30S ribosomal protein S9 [Candidatus Pacebacteria bacterium]|nr:30S ribosomal protein S9 [Candidatus Paceibacterota bacterium]
MAKKETQYIPAIGRRKRATAQVRITPDTKMTYVINDKSIDDYFSVETFKNVIRAPFALAETKDEFNVSVIVTGGGMSAQADAIRHGISRCLIKYNEDLRGDLKSAGYLKRDPRRKERKKPGLLKARKRPAWSKR